MNLQPLVEGVRTGAINSIMFPREPGGERAAHHQRPARHLPAVPRAASSSARWRSSGGARRRWSASSLGVIIEITGNIAIVGVLKVALPHADAPLIVIQVNFVGAIEFDKQRLYFFAALFESRIVFLTLEGELGLLVAWGDDANFVLSVGGFHPRFNPPPLPFPSAAAHRGQHAQHQTSRASAPRPTSRSRRTPSSSARTRR